MPKALRYDSQPRGPVVARFALRGSMQYPVITPLAARRASFSLNVRRLATATACAMALAALPALAQGDEAAEVNRLLRAGQYSEALNKADQALAAKPKDPQLRFLKGVIQTESGKTSDAMVTFTKLTEDFPELPEPYNNLAVLYANLSQFDKARAALEMAIRTNPSYATAHENLGDVYAKLASQAYSKALQLDAGNTAVPPKLNLIRNLFNGPAGGSRPASAVLAPAAAKASASAAPASQATPAPVAAPASSAAQGEVQNAVDAWAKAWSSKDVNGYLGAYGPEFVPPNGQNRKAWEAERRSRIEPRKSISVTVSDLKVEVNGDKATAQFRQAYNSDSLNITSRKRLDLAKSGNRWLIVRESTGS